MAGAGYKLFNTGDVLTAAQVNTYLMEQTVMVFADAAARTAALSGVVSEGMISYLKDTNAVEVYNGSAWVASDDPNAIQNTIVDAKGDLITATAADTPARLAVGNNGETLVADSSASTGLRWNPSSVAGKNKIINGDFRIWQRGTTFNSIANSAYAADRWIFGTLGDTVNVTRQSLTPNDITAIGYGDAQYFMRMEVVSSNGSARTEQKIEDVRTLANQNVTVSFWAKASTSTNLDVLFYQNFGSGGSTQVNLTAEVIALTTSWVRYTKTFAIPSVTGKTIGDGSHLALVLRETSASTNVSFDFFGVQVEAGSVATAFQTATGTLAGELAACQRYYWRNTTGTTYGVVGQGMSYAATNTYVILTYPVTMRTTPTSVDYGNLRVTDLVNYGLAVTAVTLSSTESDSYMAKVQADHATGATAYRPGFLAGNNNTGAYIGLSAEL